LTACALSLVLVAACDDGGSSDAGSGAVQTAMGPERTEAKMEDAKLREFVPLFPAAPEGYTRSPQPGVYISDTQSTVSFLYEKGAEMFSLTFVFSNDNTQQSLAMMDDEQTLKTWGFEVVEVKGRRALSAKERGLGKADFLVVVSNSRNVVISPSSKSLPDLQVVRQVFEQVDFAAVAAKD